MSNADFSPDWIKRFATDPYAVLGLAVTADERRILKRYHQVAKQLHPDVQSGNDDAGEAFANQVLTRFVNPAYQRLKQEKGRAETLATLRFKVRRLSREEKLQARRDLAQKLMVVPESEVDTFYEQTLTQLSEIQYESAETFIQQTAAIAELNMIYLRRKMGDPVIREKRAGLVSSATIQTPVTAPPPPPSNRSPNPSTTLNAILSGPKPTLRTSATPKQSKSYGMPSALKPLTRATTPCWAKPTYSTRWRGWPRSIFAKP